MNMLGSAARGRGRGRGRQLKVVSLQNNVMGPPTRPVLKRRGSSASAISSRINWKVCQASKTRTGTFSVTNSTVDLESTVILALTEGRGEAAGEVGIAAISTSHPSLILCQLSDSQSYMNTLTKINILNPTEILIPLTFANSFSTNRLVEKLKEQFPDIKITGVTRSTFNSNAGMEYLKRLCVPSMTSIFLVLQHKYYALSAAAALLTYTESTLYVFYAKESIKIDYQESEDSTIIDVATADRLELVASARPTIKKRYSCLLDVLNYCCTKIGVRTLRANILQPPCSMSEIEARLNCVTELMEHSDMLFSVQEILTKISNIDQLLILPTILPDHAESCSERQLNYLLTLNTVLEKIEPLYCIFENSQQPFFVELYTILSDTEFVVIKNTVRTMIHQNSYLAKGEQGAIQRCFAIKSGLNSVLDLMRKSYTERLEDMRKYVKDLSDKYGLALSLHNTNKKGYHIVLNLNVYQKRTFKRSDVPEEFIQVEQFTNSFTMKTQLLINLSHRLEDIMSEILTMSNIMIHKLLIKTHQRMAIFYSLCEAIAKLDMLQSLAQASNTMHYTRPKFGDYLELQESYHPLLYYLCSNPVPNSIYASPDYNMNIITGPNGSGKSIYIRQVVLLQVMAQVGCYVPAHSATFKLCDRILARVYLEDNIHYGASAFVLEMTEIKYFFTVLTNKTLIIIDEMCRSTSVEEGTALAMAICERLLKTEAFVFFTTHYKHLANLSDLYYNIKTWQLETCSEVKNENMLLNFTYNTIPGVVSLEHYGIFLAKATWPESIMKYVYDVIAVLMKSQKNTTIQHQKINKAARLKYDLEAEFKLLKWKKQLTRSVINEKLLNFQTGLQGMGHTTQICVDNKMDDSSIREDNFVHASEFLQIEVLAEVHNAPKDSTTLEVSQYTLCIPFSNSRDVLRTFDETASFKLIQNDDYANTSELTFENVQLSQIPSQSMMNLSPNENGQVNISRAISQKLSPKHSLEYSPQYFDNYEPLLIANRTENYLKSPTGTPLFYNPSYLSSTNQNNSELDRTSQQEGTIYKVSQNSFLRNDVTISSLKSDSTKVVKFNESMASLTENEFFKKLEDNPERASTPIPTELQNQFEEEVIEQPSDSSRLQTSSNSIKWTEKNKSKTDLHEMLNDVESCSEYFSVTEWDHIDNDVHLQMQNQNQLEEQRSLNMFGVDDEFQEIEKNLLLLVDEVESTLGGTTSADGSKIRSNCNNSILKSSIYFSNGKEKSLEKRKPNFDVNNGKLSDYGQLETLQESKREKTSSDLRNISRESTNGILSSNCDENIDDVFEEDFLRQIGLLNKVASNSTKSNSDDIKWGSTENPLILNSNQPTITAAKKNLNVPPTSSSSYSGWSNPRKGVLNKNDPRLKTHQRYLSQPERNFCSEPRYQLTEILLPPNSIQYSTSHSGCSNQAVLSLSDSTKSREYFLQKSEKGFDQRNISNSDSDKNARNKPERKMELPLNNSHSSKLSSDIHHRIKSSTSISRVNEIHPPSNSNYQSEISNFQSNELNIIKSSVHRRSITNLVSTSSKTTGNESEQNHLKISSNYGNHSEQGNLEKPKGRDIYQPSNSINISNVSNPQIEFNKWSYTSKKQVRHESASNNLTPNKNNGNELEERWNNNDVRSCGIVKDDKGKLLMDSGYKERNDLAIPQDKIRLNDVELTNKLKNHVHHELERKNRIKILSNILLKPGGDFCIGSTDVVTSTCNVEAENHIQKLSSTKSSNSEPGIFSKTKLSDDHNKENNCKNIHYQASKVHIPLILDGSHSKRSNSPRSNILEYLDSHVSAKNESITNSVKKDRNLKKTVSFSTQNQVAKSPILKSNTQNNSQIEINKALKSFNETLESLGDIHLELFTTNNTSDSSEENERDSDDADDEYEKPVENQTGRKRKRLGYTRFATKRLENDEKEQLKKPKFAPPFKAESSRKATTTSTVSTLSKREMEQIYLEKNREVLESNNVSLYISEIMNRPSIRQLKQAEHIVTAYKTSEGVLVVPAKKKTSKKKKFVAPLKQSCGNFDATIFSDKNSNKYQEIMEESKNRNFRTGSKPFEIVSSGVVSKQSRRSVFDKSNESFAFSDTSFFKSLNTKVRNEKSNQEIGFLDNSQHQQHIDSLMHKYLDTKSMDQSNKGSVIEISSSPENDNKPDFNSSFFSHSTFNFD